MHEAIELAVALRVRPTQPYCLALADRARALFLVLPRGRIAPRRARLAPGRSPCVAAASAVTAGSAIAAVAALGGERGHGILRARLQRDRARHEYDPHAQHDQSSAHDVPQALAAPASEKECCNFGDN